MVFFGVPVDSLDFDLQDNLNVSLLVLIDSL